MPNEFPEVTARPRYKVTNLYDCDYLLDENHTIILQANRPPSVRDMECVANRFNQLDALRAAAKHALERIEAMYNANLYTSSMNYYGMAEVRTQLRAALHPQPEEEEGK